VADDDLTAAALDVPDLTVAVVAAAAAALGVPELTGAADLGGSSRSLVLRAWAGDRPVVIKAPLETGEGPVRELAALRTLAGVPGVPRLLATADHPPLVVLEDLGGGPSVADALLGADPAAAADAVADWAATLGTLQAATRGLRDRFAAELAAASPLGPPPVDTAPGTLAETADRLARQLPEVGVTPSAAALGELRAIADALSDPAAAALSPGDTCPDNNIRTANGYTLIDFEAAEFHHLAWEAAYLRVPWPSCWCAWTMPAEVADRALARWTAAVGPLPATFAADLERATAAWAFVTTAWYLPRIRAGGDTSDGRQPLRRAMLQHRLDLAATGTGPLADLAAETAAALRRTHGDHPLLPAPAFRQPSPGVRLDHRPPG
jgi:hypothetical protein